MKSKKTLVLVPSVGLIKQTKDEWLKHKKMILIIYVFVMIKKLVLLNLKKMNCHRGMNRIIKL